ncbi:MAG: hypothetical protein NT115_16365 [Proteobacteria bacterium]|nr:hypothetical protein [Pseudomonadota bacterium]
MNRKVQESGLTASAGGAITNTTQAFACVLFWNRQNNMVRRKSGMTILRHH